MQLSDEVRVVRSVFLLRVYILLWFQSLLFLSICALCWLVLPDRLEHVVCNMRMMLFCLMLSVICLGILNWAEPQFPKNLFVSLIYTLLTAVAVTTSGFQFGNRSAVYAMLSTVLLFIVLSISTYRFARDVEFYRPLVTASSALIIILASIFYYFPDEVGEMVVMFGGLAVIVASVICDTQDTLHRIEYESYIPAALCLYMDLMYLFVTLLYFVSTPNSQEVSRVVYKS
ncbi:membrane protein US21 [macacine betaherpesvirus 3]|uniref:Rh202 n=2 Tax=Rhesus cytomegalovirus (strain 68-1) TaxID=47929 RepID=Q2FA94_RHCM6|nr:rh202 [macacine betaherpesvirus 3]AAP50723.1 rh202 [macacine betaherpesvirus 3]QMS44122.1 Rh202 [synthetic construct]QQL10671.1 Rh202 [Rhesus cytomegalovirus strain 68-1.2]QQL10855.1 Rh202 [Rhesus cytomegalovirus strain 68-1_FL]AAZ80721.1 rhUS21 [macacine betaherpesvirus 3]